MPCVILGCTCTSYSLAANGLTLFLQVQADVVSTLKGKLDLFNLDIFLSFLPVLAGLLTSKAER